VSSKVAGPVASLNDRALDRILAFAGEVGLVVLIHNDMDVPFAKEGSRPAYLDDVRALFTRNPGATIIWAHTGVGRVVRPIKNHAANLANILADPQLRHVYFDLSWEEVAKYIVSTPEATRITAGLISKYPDRFLFGTDTVAPANQSEYTKIYYRYHPLWNLLDPETSKKVRLTNYERIFSKARRKVRTWEAQHVKRP
jgi:predicted TIM-barrel fold metal-dependent hydrolase